MRLIFSFFAGVYAALAVGHIMMAQNMSAPNDAQSSLTIYNQDFALIRMPVLLDLKSGNTAVSVTNVTAQVEPHSVVLRDPTASAHSYR